MHAFRLLTAAVLAVMALLSPVQIGLVPSLTEEECRQVSLEICVIQLGVQDRKGTVSWLPGYVYLDVPISQCQNKTDILGQDVLGRTIVTHEFSHYHYSCLTTTTSTTQGTTTTSTTQGSTTTTTTTAGTTTTTTI